MPWSNDDWDRVVKSVGYHKMTEAIKKGDRQFVSKHFSKREEFKKLDKTERLHLKGEAEALTYLTKEARKNGLTIFGKSIK